MACVCVQSANMCYYACEWRALSWAVLVSSEWCCGMCLLVHSIPISYRNECSDCFICECSGAVCYVHPCAVYVSAYIGRVRECRVMLWALRVSIRHAHTQPTCMLTISSQQQQPQSVAFSGSQQQHSAFSSSIQQQQPAAAASSSPTDPRPEPRTVVRFCTAHVTVASPPSIVKSMFLIGCYIAQGAAAMYGMYGNAAGRRGHSVFLGCHRAGGHPRPRARAGRQSSMFKSNGQRHRVQRGRLSGDTALAHGEPSCTGVDAAQLAPPMVVLAPCPLLLVCTHVLLPATTHPRCTALPSAAAPQSSADHRSSLQVHARL
jgi:hypothetical protein